MQYNLLDFVTLTSASYIHNIGTVSNIQNSQSWQSVSRVSCNMHAYTEVYIYTHIQ